MSFKLNKYNPAPSKRYYLKAGSTPLSFQITKTKRSVALSSREELLPPLTQEEYMSTEIQELLKSNELFLLKEV